MGVVPALTAVKDVISPVPEEANPMDELLLSQLNVVPLTNPPNEIPVKEAPLQSVCELIGFTVGVGLTLMVNI